MCCRVLGPMTLTRDHTSFGILCSMTYRKHAHLEAVANSLICEVPLRAQYTGATFANHKNGT